MKSKNTEKIEKIATIESYYKELLKKSHRDDIDSYIYNMSTLLIASSLLGSSSYQKIEEEMNRYINEVQPLSKQAWMLGRMLMAVILRQSDSMATDNSSTFVYKRQSEKLKRQLEELLKNKNMTKDVMRGWAIGYLASVDRATYDDYKWQLTQCLSDVMKNYQKSKRSNHLSDFLWTMTMNVNAAAQVNDVEGYRYYMGKLETLIKDKDMEMNFITEAVNAMPVSDYRAWLLSLNEQAANKMNHKEHAFKFGQLLTETLEKNEIGDRDRIVAEVNRLMMREPVSRQMLHEYGIYVNKRKENNKSEIKSKEKGNQNVPKTAL